MSVRRCRDWRPPFLPTVPDDLVGQHLGLAELWGGSVDRLVEAMARAGTPEQALMFLQAHLLYEFRTAVRVDPLVGEAVKVLMPWHPVDIGTLAVPPSGSPASPWAAGSVCSGASTG